MARWKELPAALDGREQRLVAELRRLKDHSGLSLAALAAKTGYSRSSWERYLNGKQPVPREAVEELAAVCGVEPTRLVVLHDVAVRARRDAPGRTATAVLDGGQPQEDRDGVAEEPAPTVRTVSLRGFVAGVVAAVALSFTAGLLTGGVWADDGKAAADTGKSGYRRGVAYTCDIGRQDGDLRAGHSTNREILLDINSTGFDVVEVQCLLREHGFDPGTTDGLYGQTTKDAATRFQAARGLVADGIVGPKSWGELRK
ncbi:helix-turn-helix domain-containing protein [Streptomyces sp. NPDC006450]|uniref:helix-turn-helix domain-containing protein n=1 Tax=Streptomyces sp. NPDC006450 TaxID=3155458 RepID=UPI0033A69C07